MENERDHDEGEATSVQKPTGTSPDRDLAFDPTMTDTDEANIPPDSTADPTTEDE